MPESTQDENPLLSLISKAAYECSRLVLISGAVTTGLFPLIVLAQLSQTQNPLASRKSLAFLSQWNGLKFGAAATLMRALIPTTATNTLKNGGRLYRDDVWSFSDQLHGEKTEKLPTELPIITLATASLSVGLISATLGQYTSIFKILKIEDGARAISHRDHSPQKLKMNSLKQRYKLFKIGYPLGILKESILLSGYYFTPYLKAKLNLIDDENDNVFNSLITTSILGGVTGSLTHVLGLIRTRQISQISLDTLTAPSTLDITKTFYAQKGIRGFAAGGGFTLLQTIGAYNLVPWVEDKVNAFLPTVTEAFHRHSARFFKLSQPAKSESKSEEPKPQGTLRKP